MGGVEPIWRGMRLNERQDTAVSMIPTVGERVLIWSESFKIVVRILDVKSAYGSRRLLVTPEPGEGATWVSESRVIRKVSE